MRSGDLASVRARAGHHPESHQAPARSL